MPIWFAAAWPTRGYCSPRGSTDDGCLSALSPTGTISWLRSIAGTGHSITAYCAPPHWSSVSARVPRRHRSGLACTLNASLSFIPAGQHFDAGLMDIAPTVLHLMGVPVPEETDGRVLLDLFAESAPIRKREICTEPLGIEGEKANEYTVDELAEIEEQLRGLGYIG